ncbi:leucine-rich repeat, immunoglobulin-like domain and transmembrane domain-containing protein 2 isoform X1 [Stegostoma tigrinum]|uniref:leucine-rich repeat, immunoglobulin-like domain and transmembrane domain-containing protein 2 isoform X1 n=1 Tax=Stegostoma tigrinum TaxID=3053191 RepID=UPI00202B9982|nr:leucine-rich repeat, immunoglobulin-like domain and transmembrane domain-containing protein 2 isoform X1 [Stegostoma tigrinum]XP_048419211.1 leucine-rich repeat, immunoglobulin-like domain and transmembrane domain-containing protein 2 isoform X1 [Stegostoma tigrinum]XP_048419212.1 leucine-rich repeat, immunoglobulin-like domain and transmembrane domain-containing protein 2 isoform X1 [Stegostoma tigrinum]XP_048419213.1 leucine-rich repeat, immunoglobulin-like domain and transmembrane domain-c
MDLIWNMFCLLLVCCTKATVASCVSECSCRNDSFGRSLICMPSSLQRIPEDIPLDVRKIRIENSHLAELPRGAFSRIRALEYLWLNFNQIALMHVKSLQHLHHLSELRLQGNKLRSVPWTAFQECPALKILDLKHNRLDVLPEYALRYLTNLTYLDISFNQLTVISRDVFLNWPVYQRTQQPRDQGSSNSNAVLSLHDNPWLCDCRLKGFVQFIKSISPRLILMNSYLSCSGPESRAGKFFYEVELKSCFKPLATAEITNVSVPLGEEVHLFCEAKGNPTPTVWWTNGGKIIRKFNVSVTNINEETVKSELVIPSAHSMTEGSYICITTNYLGNSSVQILVNILTSETLPGPSSLSPTPLEEENVYIDVRIAKQTVYGITLEWYAATQNPAETWYTLHFGKFEDTKKEMIYIGPGVNTYSVNDLFPATKYTVCVTLRNQPPKRGQCIIFVTGNDISELEQREKLIHIIVIVCAMVLTVPAGMYACTTETRFSCFDKCSKFCRRQRREKTLKTRAQDVTFDSLQTGSDAELCNRNSKEDRRRRKKPEDKAHKVKTEHKNTDELY